MLTEKNRQKTVKIFEKCNRIILRDENSAKLLKDLGLKKDLQVTCDPVLALTTEDVGLETGQKLLAELGVLDSRGRKTKPLLIACVRSWKDNKHLEQLAKSWTIRPELAVMYFWRRLIIPRIWNQFPSSATK